MALVMPHSIFIHIPKTGGSWVRNVIRRSGIPSQEIGPCDLGQIQVLHASIHQVPKKLRRTRLAFAFIRHPVSWLKSKWAYAISRGKLKAKPKTGVDRCLHKDLNVFMENILQTNPGLPSSAMLHRLGWKRVDGTWSNGLKRKVHIGKNETLSQDLLKFMRSAGEPLDPSMCKLKPVRVAGKKSKQQVTTELAHRICEANSVLMEIGVY